MQFMSASTNWKQNRNHNFEPNRLKSERIARRNQDSTIPQYEPLSIPPPPLLPAATASTCDLTNPRSMQQDISSMRGNREMLVRGTPGNAFFF
jgi:hypothetical protein